ncbi:MAG: hypothetical protein GXW90_00560 [Tepidanaerobacter acetatoxydans]|uniref:hypothetical protein n=1 Tax=Tepidanaerobacter acetatoxydans TaxID=499229 RepID=UPI0026ED77AE|nr:hypothetical protein [Tepidanaerobacter acetatoxydans]NLU09438.1 hypothetical protein [Tepidanaerobacter acetatoxydans]
MAKFKDFIKKDIKTFINFDEFAEIHDIDGENIECILDEDIFKERNLNSQTRHFEGVFVNQVSLFIKKEDKERPSIGQQMHIDGRMYLVANVSEAEGIYEIELARNDY